MEKINVKIEDSWKTALDAEFKKAYFGELKKFIVEEKKKYEVYPPGKFIFNAFDSTPFDKIKVVIIGQDPYHGAGQAHGLCFSVSDGVTPPPSLKNIFKELCSDIDNFKMPKTGNLTPWAKQGVLLLNAVLTVRANTPESHKKRGWETFTDSVIKIISDKHENIVFLLWGNYAKSKAEIIDHKKHLLLFAAHPSPLSASRGFLGCKHFSKTNEWLSAHNQSPINWQL